MNVWISRFCYLFLTLILLCPSSFAGDRAVRHLNQLPAGITLPVTLETNLDGKHIHPGEIIVASLYQRVPLANGLYLPKGAKILGSVVSYDGKTLKLKWTELKLDGQTEPIAVKLMAAAHWIEVGNTKLPLGATDRSISSPADWTTMQIGRDEVYRAGWFGTVYNQYSEPVGTADNTGVYAAPQSPGALPRAMGPFSTTSAGLYGLQGMILVSPGEADGPVVFHLETDKWQLHSGDALLLEAID